VQSRDQIEPTQATHHNQKRGVSPTKPHASKGCIYGTNIINSLVLLQCV
jgi:hypothetical protein